MSDKQSYLCVDGDKDFLDVLAWSIKDLGPRSSVVKSQDGVQGLGYASSKEFNTIIIDYDMENLTGLEFIEALRKSEGPNQETPILLITGKDIDFIGEVNKNQKYQEYWRNVTFLQRPFDFKRLGLYLKLSKRRVVADI